MEFNLIVDPEFKDKIPPLTEAEFMQLEENILEAGKVYEPIVTWNKTIIDGHNRYKIAQKHPEITWEIREMEFADKWEAFDWMFRNQLGRRNLSDEQRAYALGMMYEARKHVHGTNQHTIKRSDQNDHSSKVLVREQIALEQGVGPATVQRAAEYAQGINVIKEEDPELAESILSGKKKVVMKTVQDIGKADPETKGEIIKAIREERRGPGRPTKEEAKRRQEELELTQRYIAESRRKDTKLMLTIDDLITSLKVNTTPYIRLMNHIIDGHAEVIKGNVDIVIKTIDEFVTVKIDELKERIRKSYV